MSTNSKTTLNDTSSTTETTSSTDITLSSNENVSSTTENNKIFSISSTVLSGLKESVATMNVTQGSTASDSTTNVYTNITQTEGTSLIEATNHISESTSYKTALTSTTGSKMTTNSNISPDSTESSSTSVSSTGSTYTYISSNAAGMSNKSGPAYNYTSSTTETASTSYGTTYIEKNVTPPFERTESSTHFDVSTKKIATSITNENTGLSTTTSRTTDIAPENRASSMLSSFMNKSNYVSTTPSTVSSGSEECRSTINVTLGSQTSETTTNVDTSIPQTVTVRSQTSKTTSFSTKNSVGSVSSKTSSIINVTIGPTTSSATTNLTPKIKSNMMTTNVLTNNNISSITSIFSTDKATDYVSISNTPVGTNISTVSQFSTKSTAHTPTNKISQGKYSTKTANFNSESISYSTALTSITGSKTSTNSNVSLENTESNSTSVSSTGISDIYTSSNAAGMSTKTLNDTSSTTETIFTRNVTLSSNENISSTTKNNKIFSNSSTVWSGLKESVATMNVTQGSTASDSTTNVYTNITQTVTVGAETAISSMIDVSTDKTTSSAATNLTLGTKSNIRTSNVLKNSITSSLTSTFSTDKVTDHVSTSYTPVRTKSSTVSQPSSKRTTHSTTNKISEGTSHTQTANLNSEGTSYSSASTSTTGSKSSINSNVSPGSTESSSASVSSTGSTETYTPSNAAGMSIKSGATFNETSSTTQTASTSYDTTYIEKNVTSRFISTESSTGSGVSTTTSKSTYIAAESKASSLFSSSITNSNKMSTISSTVSSGSTESRSTREVTQGSRAFETTSKIDTSIAKTVNVVSQTSKTASSSTETNVPSGSSKTFSIINVTIGRTTSNATTNLTPEIKSNMTTTNVLTNNNVSSITSTFSTDKTTDNVSTSYTPERTKSSTVSQSSTKSMAYTTTNKILQDTNPTKTANNNSESTSYSISSTSTTGSKFFANSNVSPEGTESSSISLSYTGSTDIYNPSNAQGMSTKPGTTLNDISSTTETTRTSNVTPKGKENVTSPFGSSEPSILIDLSTKSIDKSKTLENTDLSLVTSKTTDIALDSTVSSLLPPSTAKSKMMSTNLSTVSSGLNESATTLSVTKDSTTSDTTTNVDASILQTVTVGAETSGTGSSSIITRFGSVSSATTSVIDVTTGKTSSSATTDLTPRTESNISIPNVINNSNISSITSTFTTDKATDNVSTYYTPERTTSSTASQPPSKSIAHTTSNKISGSTQSTKTSNHISESTFYSAASTSSTDSETSTNSNVSPESIESSSTSVISTGITETYIPSNAAGMSSKSETLFSDASSTTETTPSSNSTPYIDKYMTPSFISTESSTRIDVSTKNIATIEANKKTVLYTVTSKTTDIVSESTASSMFSPSLTKSNKVISTSSFVSMDKNESGSISVTQSSTGYDTTTNVDTSIPQIVTDTASPSSKTHFDSVSSKTPSMINVTIRQTTYSAITNHPSGIKSNITTPNVLTNSYTSTIASTFITDKATDFSTSNTPLRTTSGTVSQPSSKISSNTTTNKISQGTDSAYHISKGTSYSTGSTSSIVRKTSTNLSNISPSSTKSSSKPFNSTGSKKFYTPSNPSGTSTRPGTTSNDTSSNAETTLTSNVTPFKIENITSQVISTESSSAIDISTKGIASSKTFGNKEHSTAPSKSTDIAPESTALSELSSAINSNKASTISSTVSLEYTQSGATRSHTQESTASENKNNVDTSSTPTVIVGIGTSGTSIATSYIATRTKSNKTTSNVKTQSSISSITSTLSTDKASNNVSTTSSTLRSHSGTVFEASTKSTAHTTVNKLTRPSIASTELKNHISESTFYIKETTSSIGSKTSTSLSYVSLDSREYSSSALTSSPGSTESYSLPNATGISTKSGTSLNDTSGTSTTNYVTPYGKNNATSSVISTESGTSVSSTTTNSTGNLYVISEKTISAQQSGGQTTLTIISSKTTLSTKESMHSLSITVSPLTSSTIGTKSKVSQAAEIVSQGISETLTPRTTKALTTTESPLSIPYTSTLVMTAATTTTTRTMTSSPRTIKTEMSPTPVGSNGVTTTTTTTTTTTPTIGQISKTSKLTLKPTTTALTSTTLSSSSQSNIVTSRDVSSVFSSTIILQTTSSQEFTDSKRLYSSASVTPVSELSVTTTTSKTTTESPLTLLTKTTFEASKVPTASIKITTPGASITISNGTTNIRTVTELLTPTLQPSTSPQFSTSTLLITETIISLPSLPSFQPSVSLSSSFKRSITSSFTDSEYSYPISMTSRDKQTKSSLTTTLSSFSYSSPFATLTVKKEHSSSSQAMLSSSTIPLSSKSVSTSILPSSSRQSISPSAAMSSQSSDKTSLYIPKTTVPSSTRLSYSSTISVSSIHLTLSDKLSSSLSTTRMFTSSSTIMYSPTTLVLSSTRLSSTIISSASSSSSIEESFSTKIVPTSSLTLIETSSSNPTSKRLISSLPLSTTIMPASTLQSTPSSINLSFLSSDISVLNTKTSLVLSSTGASHSTSMSSSSIQMISSQKQSKNLSTKRILASSSTVMFSTSSRSSLQESLSTKIVPTLSSKFIESSSSDYLTSKSMISSLPLSTTLMPTSSLQSITSSIDLSSMSSDISVSNTKTTIVLSSTSVSYSPSMSSSSIQITSSGKHSTSLSPTLIFSPSSTVMFSASSFSSKESFSTKITSTLSSTLIESSSFALPSTNLTTETMLASSSTVMFSTSSSFSLQESFSTKIAPTLSSKFIESSSSDYLTSRNVISSLPLSTTIISTPSLQSISSSIDLSSMSSDISVSNTITTIVLSSASLSYASSVSGVSIQSTSSDKHSKSLSTTLSFAPSSTVMFSASSFSLDESFSTMIAQKLSSTLIESSSFALPTSKSIISPLPSFKTFLLSSPLQSISSSISMSILSRDTTISKALTKNIIPSSSFRSETPLNSTSSLTFKSTRDQLSDLQSPTIPLIISSQVQTAVTSFSISVLPTLSTRAPITETALTTITPSTSSVGNLSTIHSPTMSSLTSHVKINDSVSKSEIISSSSFSSVIMFSSFSSSQEDTISTIGPTKTTEILTKMHSTTKSTVASTSVTSGSSVNLASSSASSVSFVASTTVPITSVVPSSSMIIPTLSVVTTASITTPQPIMNTTLPTTRAAPPETSTTWSPETSTSSKLLSFSNIVIEFGSSINDQAIEVTGNDDFYGPIDTPIGFACGCEWSKQLHISVNGFVVLGSRWGSAPPRPPKIPVDPTDTNGIRPHIIAPFWTDLKFRTNISNVWYQIYYVYAPIGSGWNNNLTLIEKFKDESKNLTGFEPLQTVVITWDKMVPIDLDESSSDEYITFQLVMMTDGRNNFAVFNYGENNFTSINLVKRPASMSWQCSQRSYENLLSLSTNIYEEAFQNTNDLGNGDIDTKGRWLFKLDYCPLSYVNYRNKCYNWSYDEMNTSGLVANMTHINELTPNCPCDAGSAAEDKRFEQVSMGFGLCYSTSFPALDDKGIRLCCYDESAGQSLLTTIPGAGFLSHYSPLRAAVDYQKHDWEPYTWCCEKSDLCDLFIARRPIDDCTNYKSPSPSFMYGDPHIKTLDGVEYAFNGHGEYTLLRIYDSTNRVVFELQGRTEPVNSTITNERINATVFTAFSAEDKISGGYFHVEENIAKNGFILYSYLSSEAVDHTLDFLGDISNIVHKDIIIRKVSDTSLDAVFSNGITVRVRVSLQLFDASLTLPQRFRTNHRMEGLFGNNDGDRTNDFGFPDGALLPFNSTEKEIFAYGETWRTTSTSSLFQYRAGFKHADYQFPDFKPLFLEDFTDKQRADAASICGSGNNFACIYDYLATQDTNIAVQTQNVTNEAEVISKTAENSAPTVRFEQEKIYAKVKDTVKINVAVDDLDLENVTLYFFGPENVVKKGTNFTYSYSWTIENTQPVNISVYAEDSLVSSAQLRMPVSICSGCSGQGQCVFGGAIATCNCNPGWEGDDCSRDIDECESKPCAGNSNCTDYTPQQKKLNGIGYDCLCLDGFTKIDGKCIDVDECSLGTPCDQNCENTEGSYSCSCNSGYSLTADNRCQDIDECAMNTCQCEQICENVEGSYKCNCKSNYTLQSDGLSCKIEETLKQLCTANGCEDCERDGDFGVKCFCKMGYELATDGKTCQDLNECESSTCSQNCTNSVGSYKCSCFDGYQLSSDKHSCIPCQNGKWGPECQNICGCVYATRCDKSFGCVCQPGWTGVSCDIDVDECGADFSPCSLLQDCSNTPGSYSCQCKEGYEETANKSCSNINECLPGGDNNCNTDTQECIDLTPGYICQCRSGYIEQNSICQDIDECIVKHDCEQICVNVNGSYNCRCHVGYLLKDDRRTCEKSRDPCTGSGNNVTYESCIGQGAYGCRSNGIDGECFCQNGYKLSPSGSCESINECEPNNGKGSCSDICTDLDISFSCSCDEGRQLLNDGLTCQACNETSKWGSNCDKNCNCGPGSLYCDSVTGCKCMEGWTGTRCGVNKNECISGVSVCVNNEKCIDTPGSFVCVCEEGYKYNNVDNQCMDIDECVEKRECSQRCVNSPGSYLCACMIGFEFAPGSSSECININECLLNSNDCEQGCVDTIGSYTCFCNDGFKLSNDQKSCIKDNATDPCVDFNINCEYGCNVVNDVPACYCAHDFKVNPADNSSCIALNNKLWVNITLDLEYLSVYNRQSSAGYKNIVSDLRESLLAYYQSANLTHIIDIRIENISSNFEVEHVAFFDVENITTAMELELAEVLKNAREHVLKVGQVETSILKETTIATSAKGSSSYVTCTLCSPAICFLKDDVKDIYSCEIQPDVGKFIPIELEVKRSFQISLQDKLSPAFAQLSRAVKMSLNTLFSTVPGFAGIGPLTFREGSVRNQGSTYIKTSVLFNTTVGNTQMTEVAGRLMDLDVDGCLNIGEDCVQLVGQSVLGTKNEIAACKLCSENEECGKSKTDGSFKCIPKDTSIPSSADSSDLILGLGIGIPLFLIVLAILIIIFIYCLRRRREYNYDSRDSYTDAYNVRQAFGSLSSAFSGRNSDFSETGGLFNRQYRKNWDKPTEKEEPSTVINYYRDPDRRDPYTQIYPQLTRSIIQPSAPLQEPQVGSDFSWDFLYNALQPNADFRIQRPQVNTRPAEVFQDSQA